VRVYNSEDFGTLVEMYSNFEPKRVAQGLPPPDVPRIARWLDQLQHSSHALLAYDGKKIVAQPSSARFAKMRSSSRFLSFRITERKGWEPR